MNSRKEYAYQRRRLGEQLRLDKKSISDRMHLHAEEEEQFQRKRLKEQLRLGKHEDDTGAVQQNIPAAEDNISVGLTEQLERLRHKVDLAVQTPSTNTSSLAIYNNGTNDKKSILDILANTHLPMPPREDASIFSLCLAPLAHFATSMFLLGAAAFYAIMSLLDVIWNDAKAKSCLAESGHLFRSCFDYTTKSFSTENRSHFFPRITDASKTFVIAFWYITKCIILRARHSKYSNQSLDAAIGSLRYGVYMARSMNVIWQRLMGRLQGIKGPRIDENSRQMETETRSTPKTWKRKMHLGHVLSSIKSSRAKQHYRQQSLQIQQQRVRLEKEYQGKLRALNQDRILLERERRALEEERSELICESMNLLAWCSAMGAGIDRTKVDASKQKGWGGWWRAWE